MSEAIRTENLTKKFGDFTAVDAISFSVSSSEIFGFIGANGAGKTTAIRMLNGLISPTSGRAWVAGIDVAAQPDQVKRRIGYMCQRFSLYDDLTVRENIRFYGGIYGLDRKTIRRRTEEMLDKLDFTTEANSLISSLPLGWKQKLAFSVAMLHAPEIIFLDEPTGGVDPATRRQFWELLYDAADRGVTVFVTTHYMDEAEYCDRVCIMVDGHIAALDTPRGLKQSYGVDSVDEVFVRLARGAQE